MDRAGRKTHATKRRKEITIGGRCCGRSCRLTKETNTEMKAIAVFPGQSGTVQPRVLRVGGARHGPGAGGVSGMASQAAEKPGAWAGQLHRVFSPTHRRPERQQGLLRGRRCQCPVAAGSRQRDGGVKPLSGRTGVRHDHGHHVTRRS